MELFQASNQWATRPDDERFDSLDAMYTATKAYADSAVGAVVPWDRVRVEGVGNDIHVLGATGVQAMVTNYAFGQLAGRAGAPAGYLRTLPASLAANNLNHGLAHKGDDTEAQLMFHQNGNLLLRAATSTRYERVWNWEVIARMIDFSGDHGLVPAQATFDWANRRPGGVEVGGTPLDPTADKSLYASDHDMFAFIMDPNKVVEGPSGPMRRGVIAINSEVGDKSLELMGFLFVDVCRNHIIWGAEGITSIKFRHVGDIRNKWPAAMLEVKKYLNSSASLEEAAFESFRARIGEDKDQVLDKLFSLKALGLPRVALDAAYNAVVPSEDGDARSVWGMSQGITRHSQTLPYAEDRQLMDKAAGRLLTIAF